MSFLTRRNLYTVSVVLLVLPAFLVRILPALAPTIRVVIALLIFPAVSVALLVEALQPVVAMYRNTVDGDWSTKHIMLRLVLLIISAGVVIFLVIPMWRGAIELYILGRQPDTITGVIDSQGSGL